VHYYNSVYCRQGSLHSCDLPDRPLLDAGSLVIAQVAWPTSGRGHIVSSLSIWPRPLVGHATCAITRLPLSIPVLSGTRSQPYAGRLHLVHYYNSALFSVHYYLQVVIIGQ